MRSGRALGSATSASRLILGALVSGVDYVQTVRRRRELRAELQAATRGLDVVLTATQPAEAAKIDAAPKWDLFDRPNFTLPFNVAGYRRSRCAQALVTADCRSRSNSSQAVPGADPIPHCRPLREDHPMPRPAPGAHRRLRRYWTKVAAGHALLAFGIRILGRCFAGREQQPGEPDLRVLRFSADELDQKRPLVAIVE